MKTGHKNPLAWYGGTVADDLTPRTRELFKTPLQTPPDAPCGDEREIDDAWLQLAKKTAAKSVHQAHKRAGVKVKEVFEI